MCSIDSNNNLKHIICVLWSVRFKSDGTRKEPFPCMG